MTATAIATDQRQFRQFIGGEWVDAVSGETFDDHNPYTGDVFAKVAAGSREDARRAIDAAAEAFPAWASTPPAQRQQVFLKAADILERRRDEVVGVLALETGSGFGLACSR